MIITTRRLPLAAWWLSHGLRYIETSALEDAFNCVFVFDDPAQLERGLTTAFFEDEEAQKLLYARTALARSLTVAKRSPAKRCTQLPPSRGATG
jgi:hypothetical protein